MAKFPFIYNYDNARAYYGPSLEDPRKQTRPYWMTEQDASLYSDSHPFSLAATAATVGGTAFASGFAPWKNQRLWNHYVPFVRAIEEYSPGQIFRTFQVSNFLSQFEKRPDLFLSPADLAKNQTYAQYMTKVLDTGPGTWQRMMEEGITVRKGQAFWGKGEEVALKYASVITTPEGASQYFGSGFARTIGAEEAFATESGGRKIPYAHNFFAKTKPLRSFQDVVNPTLDSKPAQIIGGRNLPQYIGRQAGAWGTEWVSRFNRLLRAPFEMEPMRTVFEGAQKGIQRVTGKKIGLSVAERSGLKMLGSLSTKYGLGLGLLSIGYATTDHIARESEALDETLLSEGLTPAIATLGVKANLIASELAETAGLHRYRELQEGIAPGSTDLQKLIAFPLIGAFGASIASYGTKVSIMASNQIKMGMNSVEAREAAEETMKSFGGKGRLAELGRNFTSQTGYYAREDKLGSFMRAISKPSKEGKLYFKLAGKIGPTKLAAISGAAIGLAAILPFIPGALLPSERPDELHAKYSGEKEVAIRKGRWWEFGRSPFEGGRIQYYRPHWYPRMLSRSRDKAIWGEDEPSPIEKWFKKEFTYELEKKHYKERPYPITSVPFEDVPLIGPILAGTIGRLIKPTRLMHTEEWLSDKGTLAEPPQFGQRIATELGQKPGGVPVSPYDTKSIIGEQLYRMTEMMGLPGFSMVSMKETLTGTADVFDQLKQLESARRIAGFERYYWDLELGGLLGTTEGFRRLYPHRRRQIPLYNPIRNTMPGWMPGPGDRSPDFLHGDPYTKVKEGELRLPGAGYAARFPELKGISNKDYPLIHKWKILSDIAPYSNSYGQHLQMVRAARKNQSWGDYEEKIYQQTLEQIKEKKSSRIELQEYRYLEPDGSLIGDSKHYAGEETSDLLAELNRQYSEQKEGEKGGVFDRMFGGYWELLAHNADTAWDSMTPISPGAKLVHTRSPIESYERVQVYGSSNAFWQHPWRDFLRPFTMQIGRSLGWGGIPAHIEKKREVEEYFDVLKYTKFSRLANMARFSGDTEAVRKFESKKDETLFGINPFTRNYSSIFRSLPRRDRDYFNAFSETSTVEERERILELVPDNEKALYTARWKLSFANEVKKAKEAETLSESQIAEADEMVENIYEEAKNEGFPSSQELTAEYLETRIPGETYPDWYRRTRLLSKYPPIPGADWVGYHPSVDLEDIKLKVIQNMGEDMHEFNLWPSRLRDMAYKPYINEEAIEPIINPEELTEADARARINEVFASNGVIADIFTRTSYTGTGDETEINIEHAPDISRRGRS